LRNSRGRARGQHSGRRASTIFRGGFALADEKGRYSEIVERSTEVRNDDTPELVRFPVCDGEEVGILPVVSSVYLR